MSCRFKTEQKLAKTSPIDILCVGCGGGGGGGGGGPGNGVIG
jgi:hypothetical protein